MNNIVLKIKNLFSQLATIYRITNNKSNMLINNKQVNMIKALAHQLQSTKNEEINVKSNSQLEINSYALYKIGQKIQS